MVNRPLRAGRDKIGWKTIVLLKTKTLSIIVQQQNKIIDGYFTHTENIDKQIELG